MQAGASTLGNNVAAIAVGARHSCALKTDHTLWCWGDWEFGQQSEVAAAWMHKEIAIADACASRPGSDAVTDQPEDGGKSSAVA